ncbi:transposase [Roseovarius sp. A-2]|uniref:IS66 family transposase n=1 Tax=Roseovarius sp. A-2 TaxID=1570360 RepID=UPI0020CAF1B5|nr:transposase [Roseovarius sp. A-2]
MRRKFIDKVERTGFSIVQQAIKQIAELYAVEKEAREKSPDERVTLRQAKAADLRRVGTLAAGAAMQDLR